MRKRMRRTTERDRQKIQLLTLRSQILILIKIHIHPRDSYSPFNLRIIGKLLLFPVDFPNQEFSRKILCPLFSVLRFVHVQYPILLHPSLVVKIDRPITCDEKSPPHKETTSWLQKLFWRKNIWFNGHVILLELNQKMYFVIDAHSWWLTGSHPKIVN